MCGAFQYFQATKRRNAMDEDIQGKLQQLTYMHVESQCRSDPQFLQHILQIHSKTDRWF